MWRAAGENKLYPQPEQADLTKYERTVLGWYFPEVR